MYVYLIIGFSLVFDPKNIIAIAITIAITTCVLLLLKASLVFNRGLEYLHEHFIVGSQIRNNVQILGSLGYEAPESLLDEMGEADVTPDLMLDGCDNNGCTDIEDHSSPCDDEFSAWNELRLHPLLIKSIQSLGFKELTPIQKACILAAAHQGKDVNWCRKDKIREDPCPKPSKFAMSP